ncbi:GNAT family N-acetyltransferase [Jannaschia sp. Os4]|uniref:GNAT family N-acetyltransferase n=1 Tax=Jannaschia sp. Os4 TaxID=2807617 RepID=UPI00193AC3DE|nr:GNAT family N-acetyltransferase [Jannaschia sp. Os4]MBM2577657.1 GNAT family N-acetyltransferase [Jannaschia sp. Os4]
MVRIEPQSPGHAPGLFTALSDERSYAFLDERPPSTVEAVRDRIARLAEVAPSGSGETWRNWTVFDGKVIVGYTQATIDGGGDADLAYVLHPEAWGHSVGYEACRLTLIELRSDPAVRRVVADTERGNRRSRALLDRLGFEPVREDGPDLFYRLPANAS